jgi:N-acetylmuramoyl-L-alanine amidase
MQSERESLKRLTSSRSKVSCHYLINRKGKIFRLVEDQNIAWHAGKSMWGKYKNLNKNSIGIELVNRGHRYGYQTFTRIQIKRLIELCKYLKRKYRIKNKLVLGHSDIAPLRKIDPGEKFPWGYLSSKGIGIYPGKALKSAKLQKSSISTFFYNLRIIGYRYLERKFARKIIKSFQRRYRQNRANGILDSETLKISEILAKNSNIA